MSNKVFQFRVDGRAFGSPLRDRWEDAAQDAVNAGYAQWKERGYSITYDPSGGGEIMRWTDRAAYEADQWVERQTAMAVARGELPPALPSWSTAKIILLILAAVVLEAGLIWWWASP